MTGRRPLSWYIRKFVWDSISIIIFFGKKAKKIPLPPKNPVPLRPVPLSKRIPGVQIDNIMMADHIPPGETSRIMHLAFRFRIWLTGVFPPVVHGLPEIKEDVDAAVKEAYTCGYRALYPVPRRPEIYEGSNLPDLGLVATTSPYACFLQRDAEGKFLWDFRDLDDHEIYPGLRPLGSCVEFKLDVGNRRLFATKISCVLGEITPDDDRWEEAVRTAMCAASTQISLVNHFNWVHLACGGPFSVATRNNLHRDHPLCRLMWPHMFGTQNSNYLVTMGQMLHRGDFETIFSFTHDGMCGLFSKTYDSYRASVMVPEMDWRDRGLPTDDFDAPVQDNLQQLYDVMHAHTRRYVDAYYESDTAIAHDEVVVAWIRDLNALIPNGIGEITGGAVTREGVARLAAGFIYMASVQHEALGSLLWNYQMWVDKNPVRIHTNGRRISVDVFQRLLNANFNLNVDRAKLMQNFAYMGLDDGKGPGLFAQFYQDLINLEEICQKETKQCWRVTPGILDANINA